LAFFEPSDCGTQLNDLTGKFVTRRQGKPWAEFTFVDVEIGAADPASVNAEKDFVGLDFGNCDFAVCKFTRSVVNNGFHKREVGGAVWVRG
jgi:hypothetical protein